jgi:2-polyprenyl-6-hydroxyphenyl methylase/3-demethylubiquinone-9 3-methyltransferase
VTDAERYYDEYWEQEAPPPCGDPLTPTRLELLRGVLPPRAKVLDAGCGAGDLVSALGAEGHDATGMDVSARALEVAFDRHPEQQFVRHSAEELPWPFEAGSFDAVLAFEVVEHLLRPRRLLEGAHATLRRGGGLALTTPYHGLVKNLAVAALAFDRHYAVEGDHVRFFTDRALRRLLTETGFSVQRVRHYGRIWGLWAGVFMWAQRR